MRIFSLHLFVNNPSHFRLYPLCTGRKCRKLSVIRHFCQMEVSAFRLFSGYSCPLFGGRNQRFIMERTLLWTIAGQLLFHAPIEKAFCPSLYNRVTHSVDQAGFVSGLKRRGVFARGFPIHAACRHRRGWQGAERPGASETFPESCPRVP